MPDETAHAAQEAPPGAIWVCGACGKTSTNRYGTPSAQVHPGWDESWP